MVIAYLEHSSSQKKKNFGETLMNMFRFYGKEFNPRQHGICPNLIQG